MAPSQSPAVVMDSGTGSIKVGLAGANFPSHVIPTIVGRPVLRAGATKASSVSVSSAGSSAAASSSGSNKTHARELKDLMLGDEVTSVRHLLDITMPVKNGVVRKKDDMCLLWSHAFSSKMKIDPTERYLSISECPIASDKAREEMFEIMFETYGFAGIQSTTQGVLTLYSAGVTTGIAVDSGEGVTHCTPVFDGYGITKANRRVDIGGRDVTDNLVRLMQRRGYSLHNSADFELARAIKEQFCYAAVDWKEEKRLATETSVLEKSMTLPDGSTCNIGTERFEATECLFDPSRVGVECDGLSMQIWNSINAADIDIRPHLYQNVILAGGSTMFAGLPSRIERDMRNLFLERNAKGNKVHAAKFQLKIHDAPRRKHMVFLGGSCYAQLTADSDESWMTKAQYAEGGATLVTRTFGHHSV